MDQTNALVLTPDEIDDLLYLTRVNEAQELQQIIPELAAKYQCSPKSVLEAGIDPENGNTMLHFCSANGFADLLEPFFLSILRGPNELAKNDSLINRGNKERNTPLHWAAYNGHLAVVKLLVAAGADIWAKNSAGHLAMFEAERADKNDVVQYLLEIGGEEVEQGGSEGQASAEDVADVQEKASSDGSHPSQSSSTDVEMQDQASTD